MDNNPLDQSQQVQQPISPPVSPVISKKKLPKIIYVLIAGMIIFLLIIGAYYFGKLPIKSANNTPIACTLEAEVCPDGSAVGRTGPNCEFAPCPGGKNDETINLKTYKNEKYGYTVKYPERLTTAELIGDTYLNHVTFKLLSEAEPNTVFSIEVWKYSLEEAKKYAKWTVEGHVLVTLKNDSKITHNGAEGVKLEYVPQNYDSGIEPITFIILNNKTYSYILDFRKADTSLINQILATFKFTN